MDTSYLTKSASYLLWDLIEEDSFYNPFCVFNSSIYYITFLLSLTYNIFFCLDLFVTLKYPLISGRKRNIYYNLGAIILTTLLYSIIHFDFTPHDACKNFDGSVVNYLF